MCFERMLFHQNNMHAGNGLSGSLQEWPTYPMKKYTGDDHKLSHWKRPTQQTQQVDRKEGKNY